MIGLTCVIGGTLFISFNWIFSSCDAPASASGTCTGNKAVAFVTNVSKLNGVTNIVITNTSIDGVCDSLSAYTFSNDVLIYLFIISILLPTVSLLIC